MAPATWDVRRTASTLRPGSPITWPIRFIRTARSATSGFMAPTRTPDFFVRGDYMHRLILFFCCLSVAEAQIPVAPSPEPADSRVNETNGNYNIVNNSEVGY